MTTLAPKSSAKHKRTIHLLSIEASFRSASRWSKNVIISKKNSEQSKWRAYRTCYMKSNVKLKTFSYIMKLRLGNANVS